MKQTLIYIVLVIWPFLCICAQKDSILLVRDYYELKKTYAEAIVENSYANLTSYHGELGEDDNSLNILLKEKNNELFDVWVVQICDSDDTHVLLSATTLPDTANIYVYSAQYDSALIFYEKPSISKIKVVYDDYVSKPLRVIDVSGVWLRVQIAEDERKYDGWIPPSEYCANPYTTCN